MDEPILIKPQSYKSNPEVNCFCENCIDAILSRGEKVFVGESISVSDTDEYYDANEEEQDNIFFECEWCESEAEEVFECMFY